MSYRYRVMNSKLYRYTVTKVSGYTIYLRGSSGVEISVRSARVYRETEGEAWADAIKDTTSRLACARKRIEAATWDAQQGIKELERQLKKQQEKAKCTIK